MAEFRRCALTGRWIIIYTDKEKAPQDYQVEVHTKSGGTCPFCPGNEHMTPPEIDAHREVGTEPNKPGWLTRIVSNKFPALRIEGNLDRAGVGVYDMMNGIGAHEVIIETPDHNKQMADLMPHELEMVIWAYRNRTIDLMGDKRFKYLLIFKNFGLSAGASLEHTHSQIIALPIVPKTVQEEINGASRYFELRERCIFCDIIREEMQNEERVVTENKNFLAFAPNASRFPFETWIIPKNHNSDFSYISHEEVVDLARILREMLLRIKVSLNEPSYNFLIHSSPIDGHERNDYHWHIEMMPKLAKVAGFEWGTGFYLNYTSPETAARILREAKIK